MTNFADRLSEKIDEFQNPTVMGLDPLIEYVPLSILRKFGLDKSTDPSLKSQDRFFSLAAEAILEFNKSLIDAVKDIIPAVKPQIAYYELLGADGIKTYRETIEYAKNNGMIVIADAKRNDIGSTAAMYSAAYLGRTNTNNGSDMPAFDADALTINAYTGTDGVKPFIEDCEKYGKGIFILVRTSNPSARDFQDLILDNGQFFYEAVAEKVSLWGSGLIGENGFSSVGAVVGATWPDQAEKLRIMMPNTFILVPGYGAQGGTGETAAQCFDENGKGAIVNASRSLMLAYRKAGISEDDFQQAAYEEALRMRDDLNKHIFA
ncbi:MAG: orotidine-5'-phosphate decarboxylase [Saccharofermentanales bacterium]